MEATMGTTVATTSLFGDRLDEYDYTDYGVPLHAPIALDGRWITDMRPVNNPYSAPPVTETRGHASGMLSKWVAAGSSRCLYNGYRYESPLAGMQDWTTTTPAAVGRQGGLNFAGFAKRTDLSGGSRREGNYTLFRHYDPVLMRFTSPDPAAAQFWNLNHYAGNNPGRFQDPDGLDYENIWNHLKEGNIENAGRMDCVRPAPVRPELRLPVWRLKQLSVRNHAAILLARIFKVDRGVA